MRILPLAPRMNPVAVSGNTPLYARLADIGKGQFPLWQQLGEPLATQTREWRFLIWPFR